MSETRRVLEDLETAGRLADPLILDMSAQRLVMPAGKTYTVRQAVALHGARRFLREVACRVSSDAEVRLEWHSSATARLAALMKNKPETDACINAASLVANG